METLAGVGAFPEGSIEPAAFTGLDESRNTHTYRPTHPILSTRGYGGGSQFSNNHIRNSTGSPGGDGESQSVTRGMKCQGRTGHMQVV